MSTLAAALAAPYAPHPGAGRVISAPETKTMRPQPAARIDGTAAAQSATWASTAPN